MQQLLNYLLMLIPPIGLIAGLSLGITIPLFLASSLYLIKDQVKIHLTKIRLEIVFFILLCISSLWSNKPLVSFASFFSILSISIVIYILITNVDLLITKLKIEDTHLIIGLLGAILLFYIEFLGNGLITTLFKTTFQTKDNYDFYLYYLDRGCALMALFSWVVIASLIGNKKNTQAILVYLLVLLTLGISDNLAAFISFFVGGIVFLVTRYPFFAKPKLLSFLLILSTLTFLGMITLITPHKIIEEARFLPISAKHRLFIWDYSIQKIAQKPFIGWGHGASRNFMDDELIEYEGHKLSVFPTHPHNNIVQILLENGIVGLFIYLTLLCKYLFCWNKVFSPYQSKRLSNIKSAGFACFWTCLIISMISFNMWQNWFLCSYLWIALMLYCVTKQVLLRVIHNDSLEKGLPDY
jgi:O-antigen ligase